MYLIDWITVTSCGRLLLPLVRPITTTTTTTTMGSSAPRRLQRKRRLTLVTLITLSLYYFTDGLLPNSSFSRLRKHKSVAAKMTQPPANDETVVDTGSAENNEHHHHHHHHHNSNDDNDNDDRRAKRAIEFAHLIGRLKTTPRTGWVRRGVPRYESVADHSWRVAALSLLLAQPQPPPVENRRHDTTDPSTTAEAAASLDVAKCMQLALVHDLAECVVGDIAPDDKVSPDEKQQREARAIKQIAHILQQATDATAVSRDEPSSFDESGRSKTLASTTTTTTTSSSSSSSSSGATFLLDLLDEYEQRESAEAIAVKDLDLLDMILQADEYEQRFGMLDLSEFFASTPVDRFRHGWVRRIAHHVHAQRQVRRQQPPPPQNETAPSVWKHGISSKDAAFVEEFSKAYSHLNVASITDVVKALRAWESRSLAMDETPTV